MYPNHRGGGGKGGSKLRIKTTFFVVGEGSHGGGWVFGGGGEKGGVFWGGGGEGVLKYTPKGGVFWGVPYVTITMT